MAGNAVPGGKGPSQTPLAAEADSIRRQAAAMDAQTRQMLDRQRELQDSLARMQRQSEDTARQYKQQLSGLEAQQKQAMAQANARLAASHAQQMAAVEAEYRRARQELSQRIREAVHRLEELQNQAIQQQNARIDAMEQRLDAEDARSKAIAQRSLAETKDRWQALQHREELAVFVRPHQGTYAVAQQSMDTLYEQQQYQAVTGIAANSNALIQGWKAEAEASYQEKLALMDLCQAQLSYLTARLDEAAQRSAITCDGTATRVVLERYAPAEFQQLRTRRDAAAEQLAAAGEVTLTQMCGLLAQLERFRAEVDRLCRQALLLHRGCLRRWQCKRLVASGMRQLKFRIVKSAFCDGDFLQGISMLLRDEYSGNCLTVRFTTPDLESGRTSCQVTLYAGSLMDAGGKRALCASFTRQIHRMLSQTGSSGSASVEIGAVYRSERGAWRSDLTVQV